MKSDESTLISRFNEDGEKMRVLGEETSKVVSELLKKKREKYLFRRVRNISGRKFKIIAAFVIGINLLTLAELSNLKKVKILRELSVTSYESKIIPFLQVFEDKAYLIMEARKDIAAEKVIKDKQILKNLKENYHLTDDWVPFQKRYMVSNLTVPYHCEPFSRQYLSSTSRHFNNFNI